MVSLCRVMLCFLVLTLYACGTKNKENMIFVMQSDDFHKSCNTLDQEISDIQNNEIQSLEHQKKAKVVRNTTLFYIAIPTAFLSLLFVDFTGNETQQITLYEERISHIKQISNISGCQVY